MSVVACIQMASGPQIGANLLEAERLIQEAVSQHAQLVVLPENFALMGNTESDKVAVRETDRRARFDRAARKKFCAAPQVVRLDTDASHVVVQGQLATGFQLLVGQILLQQRVVDHLGDVGIGNIHRR